MTKSFNLSLDDLTYKKIREEYKSQYHFPTVSKYVVAMRNEYVSNHAPKDGQKDPPKTDEERLAFAVEEMGRLNEDNQIKFQAVRKMIPEGTPRPLKESEIEPFMLKIRNAVNKHNGCAMVGRKVVSISREDLERYAKLNRLDIEKNALEASLQACAPISST